MSNKSTKPLTQDEFIKKCLIIHNNKYDYSNTYYKNSTSKIKISCPIHGIFEQIAFNHKKGHGCAKCAGMMKYTINEFKERANKKHKSFFDYSEVIYKNIDTKVKISCPKHGFFYQTPYNHINKGTSCPECATGGFKKSKSAILYYFLDVETNLYKIGITNRTIETRFHKDKRIIIKNIFDGEGQIIYDIEQQLLNMFSECRVTNADWPKTYGGKTEFFNKPILINLELELEELRREVRRLKKMVGEK